MLASDSKQVEELFEYIIWKIAYLSVVIYIYISIYVSYLFGVIRWIPWILHETVRRDGYSRRLDETVNRLNETFKRILAGAAIRHAGACRVVALA